MRRIRELLVNGTEKFVSGLFGAICLLLFLCSVFETSRVSMSEAITYHRDIPLLHLGVLLCICLAFAFGKTRIKIRIPPHVLYSAGMVCLMWLVWAAGLYPKADQMILMQISPHIAQGNYQDFLPGGYLYTQPHQIFLAYCCAVLYRMFGGSYVFVFQMLNCAATVGVYRLLQKQYRRFGGEDVTGLFPAACFLFLPFGLYVTFVYGTTIGLYFALAALEALCRYLEHGYAGDFVQCTVFIILAQFLKSNYLIFLAGFAAVLLFDFIRTVNLRHMLCVCILVGSCVLCSHLLTGFTEQLTGIHSKGGIPRVLFVAMGLRGTHSAPGWWDGFHANVFERKGFDVEASEKIGRKEIRKRLKKMRRNPSYGADFFFHKLLSEWSEPTYESIWIQQQRIERRRMPWLLDRLFCHGGRLAGAYEQYCNLFQSVLYFGAVLFVFARRDRMGSAGLLIPAIFIGGFLFHLFWEAKGQYTLPYCVCLLPCCVRGYGYAAERIRTVRREGGAGRFFRRAEKKRQSKGKG